MKKLQAIIADDELDAIEILNSMLEDSDKVTVLAKIQKALDIESQLIKLKPDVLFLDIEMRGVNGLELLENIREYNQELPVIIISAFDKYISDAVKLNIFSYLTKPIDKDELYKLLDRLLCKKENQFINTDKLKLPIKEGYVYLRYGDIFLLEAESNYTRIKTVYGDEYMSSYNMGKIWEILGEKFFRINRGTVINSEYVHLVNKKKQKCYARLHKDEYEFTVSQAFIAQFNRIIN